MQAEETTIGFIEFAARHEEADVLDDAGWAALRADAKALGWLGLLVAGAIGPEAVEAEDEVADELALAVADDVRDVLGADAPPPAGDDPDLATLFAKFVEVKGADRGPLTLARLIARVTSELYDLRSHGFMGEDALSTGELLAAARAERSARALALHTTRLGRTATREVLGHLNSQLDLVHRLGNAEQPLVWPEIDRRLLEFAPRIYAQRWPSLAHRLLIDDKRFRFGCVLWARLRGVAVGRQAFVSLAQRIDPKRPMLFVQALEEGRAARTALIAAQERAKHARALEDALFVRPIDLT